MQMHLKQAGITTCSLKCLWSLKLIQARDKKYTCEKTVPNCVTFI